MRNRRTKKLEPCVTVRAEDCGGDNDRMVRRFRKMVKAEGIMEEQYQRRYFKSPSELRRMEKQEKRRIIKKVNRQREELLKPRDRYKKRG